MSRAADGSRDSGWASSLKRQGKPVDRCVVDPQKWSVMTRYIDFNQVIYSVRTKEVPLSIVVWWDHHGRAAWDASEDARELLRLLTYVDRKAAVKAACACARTTLKYIPPGEDRPLKAIQTAEAWTRGEVTEEDCRQAANAAASAARAAANAANAGAASAVRAAALAAYAAAYAAACARAEAAAAANAAAAYAANAAAEATAAHCKYEKWNQTYHQTLRELAKIVRKNAVCPTASQMARGSPASN